MCLYNRNCIAILFCFLTIGLKAQRKFSFDLHVPLAVGFQKEDITYGPDHIEKGTAFNFGISVIAKWNLPQRMIFSMGLQYYRERYNITRPYNHQALNTNDGYLIELTANNYTYHLLQVPIGISFPLSTGSNTAIFRVDYLPGFTMSSLYNGGLPYPGAKNSSGAFRFYSNDLDSSFSFPLHIQKLTCSIDPFVRAIHAYQNDRFLYETTSATKFSFADALGLNLSFQIANHHLKQ